MSIIIPTLSWIRMQTSVLKRHPLFQSELMILPCGSESIKKIFKSCGFGHLPIYLTEWNFTLSHQNLISDTCFKSCWLMKNLLRNYDRLDSFGYWSLTDLISENALPDVLFHGGLGTVHYEWAAKKTLFMSFISRII